MMTTVTGQSLLSSLGDFQIVKCLGQGASSTVYLAFPLPPAAASATPAPSDTSFDGTGTSPGAAAAEGTTGTTGAGTPVAGRIAAAASAKPLRGAATAPSTAVTASGGPVALKLVAKAALLRSGGRGGGGPDAVRRIAMACHVSAVLSPHPLIVDTRAVVLHPAALVVTMRHYSCGTLRSVLDRCPRNRLAEDDSTMRDLALELCCALAYIHSHGIVHRDIKPENVLVDATGRIALADFDLASWPPDLGGPDPAIAVPARAASALTPRTSLPSSQLSPGRPGSGNGSRTTLGLAGRARHADGHRDDNSLARPSSSSSHHHHQTYHSTSTTPATVGPGGGAPLQQQRGRRPSFVGTPLYMAPEVAKRLPDPHTAAIDMWSLGVLLYEAWFGITPFEGNSDEDTLSRLAVEAPRIPFPENPPLPKDLKDFLLALLRPKPEERLTAAQALQHRFLAGVDFRVVLARPPSLRLYCVPTGAGAATGGPSASTQSLLLAAAAAAASAPQTGNVLSAILREEEQAFLSALSHSPEYDETIFDGLRTFIHPNPNYRTGGAGGIAGSTTSAHSLSRDTSKVLDAALGQFEKGQGLTTRTNGGAKSGGSSGLGGGRV